MVDLTLFAYNRPSVVPTEKPEKRRLFACKRWPLYRCTVVRIYVHISFHILSTRKYINTIFITTVQQYNRRYLDDNCRQKLNFPVGPTFAPMYNEVF